MNNSEKKQLLDSNNVAYPSNATTAILDELIANNNLSTTAPAPAIVPVQASTDALVMLVEDENIALITLVGKREWDKSKPKNKYQLNYGIEHYYNFVYNGIPFTTVDERFVTAFEEFDLAQVTFKYSGETSATGERYIEVAAYLTEDQYEKIEARKDRKDERSFRKNMRAIKVKANPEMIRTASDMDAIFTASSAGGQ